jgi:hypothetical protein
MLCKSKNANEMTLLYKDPNFPYTLHGLITHTSTRILLLTSIGRIARYTMLGWLVCINLLI